MSALLAAILVVLQPAAPAAPAPAAPPAASAPAPEAPAPALPMLERLTWVVHAYPAFSPDGRQIAFQTSLAGHFDVWVMDVATRAARPVAASPANDITPLWSPDGKRLVFVSERDGNRDVYVAAADGSGPVNVTRHPSQDLHPAFSPDGARIIFSSNRDTSGPDDYDVWTMNADGGDLRRLTSGPEVDTYASYSPDGKRIILRRVIPEGNNEVFLMNADGSGARNLTRDPDAYDGWPVWSPDGRSIAFASGPGGRSPHRLWLMDVESGARRMLTDEDPVFHHVYDTQPHFAPDGRRIVFTRYRPGPREATELVIADLSPAGDAGPG